MANRKLSPLAWLGVALVVTIALSAALVLVSFVTYDGYAGMMGTGSWGWAMLMMGIPVVVLIIVLLAALGGLPEPMGGPISAPPAQNALEVVDQRYARGELTREDYLKIRDDLSHGPSHS